MSEPNAEDLTKLREFITGWRSSIRKHMSNDAPIRLIIVDNDLVSNRLDRYRHFETLIQHNVLRVCRYTGSHIEFEIADSYRDFFLLEYV